MSGQDHDPSGFTTVPWAGAEDAPGSGGEWVNEADEQQIGRAAELLVAAVEEVRTLEAVSERPYVVLLSGESGVGKTTLAEAMSEAYLARGVACKRLSADGYYQQPVRDSLTLVRESTGGLSVGLTEWDLDDLQRDLGAFQRGQVTSFREMDWNTCDVSAKRMEPDSTDIILVDHIMAHLLSADVAIRLMADPERITDQAERRDSLEHRETRGTPLLRTVRERERAIVAEIWSSIRHPRQLVLHDYETVATERDDGAEQDFGHKLSVLARMAYIGAATGPRVLDKLAALETSADFSNSYAELVWVEAGLRLLPEEDAEAFRDRIAAKPDYTNLHRVSQSLLDAEVKS